MNPPHASGWIKAWAGACHRAVSLSPLTARLHLSLCRWLAGRVSPFRRRQLLNSLGKVSWPEGALQPVAVRVGADTWVRLQPHNGEFDFEAVLGGVLGYEPEVFAFLDTRVRGYDAIVEIGANVGVFTVYFADKLRRTGADGRVYAFEPSEVASRRLQRNVALNHAGNVSVFQAAVGGRSGFEWFFEPHGHLTNGSLLASFAGKFSADVRKVPCLMVSAGQLIELLGDHRRILLKIDVEGYEAPLLEALAPLIQLKSPDILLEVLPEFGEAINAVAGRVAANYDYFQISRAGLMPCARIQAGESRDCFLSPARAAATPAAHP